MPPIAFIDTFLSALFCLAYQSSFLGQHLHGHIIQGCLCSRGAMHKPALVLQPSSPWAPCPAHTNELQAKLSTSHTPSGKRTCSSLTSSDLADLYHTQCTWEALMSKTAFLISPVRYTWASCFPFSLPCHCWIIIILQLISTFTHCFLSVITHWWSSSW